MGAPATTMPRSFGLLGVCSATERTCRRNARSCVSRPGSSTAADSAISKLSSSSSMSGSIRSRMASFIQVVTTPGAISKSTVSSVMPAMVACSPDVVCTRSPIRSDSCRSIVACIARRWRRDAKNMNAPMMTSSGRKMISCSMKARFFRVWCRWVGPCREASQLTSVPSAVQAAARPVVEFVGTRPPDPATAQQGG